jgi:rubrerythrin
MKEPKKKSSIIEILDFAIEKEEEAFEFYSLWAKKVQDKAISEVLLELAETEKTHKAYLLKVKSGEKTAPLPKDVTTLSISDYLVEVTPTENMDYQTALMVAMQREKSAYQLYTNMAGEVSDADIRDIFLTLAGEEAKHKLRLELIYDDEILKEN